MFRNFKTGIRLAGGASKRIQYVSRVFLSSSYEPVQMAYNDFEDSDSDKTAPPLIVMHGLFGSKQNWRGVSRALASKLKTKIITVDARNHGDSPHTIEHSSMHMAADVKEFMRQHGIPKAHVMGHSMGGRAMMYFAMKYPELVDRGIIVDISPVAVPRDFFKMEQIFMAMKTLSVPPELSMAQGRVLAETQMKDAVETKETVDFIMLNLRKRNTGEFYWAVNVDTLYNNLRHFSEFMEHVAGLAPFQGPMMFICGKQSNFVDPANWPTIQSIFPNSVMHWLDAGHLVHFDQPVQFIDLIVKFLKK